VDKAYSEYAQIFKALSDPHRLMIVDMLSCGELCACVILEKFHITQPTLSHHMKTLCGCNLVIGRKVGKWTYYSLNEETLQGLRVFMETVATAKDDCICKEGKKTWKISSNKSKNIMENSCRA
jgi:ArsR family transcriptional regulator